MNKIYAVALNLHDHNTYDGEHHNQRERHTRFKHNLPYKAEAYAHQSDILNVSDYRLNDEFTSKYFHKAPGEVLAFTYTFGGIRKSKEESLTARYVFNQLGAILWKNLVGLNYYYWQGN